MARIRSVKPELCTSETMAAVSANAERTFVRLWTHCDDEGRCKDHPKLLKAQLYPLHDDVTAEHVDADLAELERRGCIVRYRVDGEAFLSVPSWADHQRPQKPQKSKLPSPEVADQPEPDDSGSGRVPVPETYGPVVEGSGEVEVVGEVEGDGPTSTGTTSEVVEPTPPVPVVVDEQQIRACAVAVGRAIAAQEFPRPNDPAAFAAGVTKRILTGDDPHDRDRIRTELAAGSTSDDIADSWTETAPDRSWDPFFDRPGSGRVEQVRPALKTFTGHDGPGPDETIPDPLERIRALRPTATEGAKA